LKQKKFFLPLIFWLLVFVLFWIKGESFLDPDFGWHWKMGELILSKGIPKTDPFSYTMPSFPFVDHEWLTNVAIYQLDKMVGWQGLVFFFVIIGLLSLVVAGSGFRGKSHLRIFKLSLFVLGVGAILPFFGVRPQVLSWFFLALWLKVILNDKLFEKYFLFLPIFMLIWANLHGSFAVGIFCLELVLGAKFWQKKKLAGKEIFCLIFCLGATFVNPYGARLWGEVWQQISDANLRFRIAEWQPSFFKPIFPYLFFVSLGFFIYVFRRKITLEKIFLFLFFLIQSLLSLRHVPLFVIVALPICLESLECLYQRVARIKYGLKRWRKAAWGMFFLCFLVAGVEAFFVLREEKIFTESNYYPMAAVLFLRQNLPEGNLFSSYNWGGYLIWKLPEKKVFIDGRMPSWRWKAGLPRESNNAMEDYVKMLEDKEKLAEILDKYQISKVLWFNEKREKEGWLGKILARFFGQQKERLVMGEFLEERGWKKEYQDEVAVVWGRED